MRVDREVAVIVCAGRSLDAMPSGAWAEIRQAGAIVAVNGAAASEACAHHGLVFTHLAAMDLALGLAERVPRLAEIWSTTRAWRVTSADAPETPAESYIVEVDEANGVEGWSDDPDAGFKGGSTGMIIGNWLGNRGFRKLAYIGLDMLPLDGRHAAGAGTHASGFSDSIAHHGRVCRSWGKFCREAARRGIEVVNLTPGTGLAEMPRAELLPSSMVEA